MARPALSALLIVVLLLCPLGCFLRQATVGAASHSTAAAGCCRHCRPESPPAVPAPPRDDDGRGRCCLCEGALYDGPSRSVEVDLHADDLAGYRPLPPDVFSASALQHPTAEHLFGPPGESSGRTLRTQLSSLLL